MSGIYKIVAKGKVYIGKSKDIKRRISQHITASAHNRTPLYRAMQADPDWTWSVVEECAESQLNKREQYWIAYYDSFRNGWNRTIGGDTSYATSILKLKKREI